MKKHYKLSQIFFINFIILFSVAVAITSLIIYYSILDIEKEQYTRQLRSEIAYITNELKDGKSLSLATKEISTITGSQIRSTLISKDGTPIYDSQANVDSMENHASRPEVMQAWREGFGTAVRYSKTIGNDRIYAAKVINWNGKESILRLSLPLASVMSDFTTLWKRIVVVSIIALIVAFIMSYLMQKSIGDELNKITNYLSMVANKKYNASLQASFSQEFMEISKLLKKLAKKLQKSDRKRRKYTAKLKLATKQQSDIISAIGHEFKNPITAISGYTQTLLEDDDIPTSIQKKFLQKIEQNSSRINQMIDRLAIITKLESSEITLKKEVFDICDLISDSIETLQKKYSNREIDLECNSLKVDADRVLIGLMITNIIENALKYSEDEVVVRLQNSTLEVIDNGIGIKPKDIDKIRQKFYRTLNNSWDNSLGLGLAIVDYILKLHSLDMEIESEFGIGTTIRVELSSINSSQPFQDPT